VRDQSTQGEREKLASRLSNAHGLIQFIGSPEVALAANALFKEAIGGSKGETQPNLAVFVFAARKDLGDTLDRSIQREIDRALPPLDEGN
jgi:hypothetical protein